MIQEIKRLCFQSKPHRIAKNTIAPSFENGGLRIICMRSFIKSLKIIWISRLMNTQCVLFWKTLSYIFTKYWQPGNVKSLQLACSNIFGKMYLRRFTTSDYRLIMKMWQFVILYGTMNASKLVEKVYTVETGWKGE